MEQNAIEFLATCGVRVGHAYARASAWNVRKRHPVVRRCERSSRLTFISDAGLRCESETETGSLERRVQELDLTR